MVLNLVKRFSNLIKRCGAPLALLLLLAHPADLSSCGPFFPVAVFTREQAPENENAFFHGRLGILLPTYERRYLAMAYRLASGEPLSDSQVASVSNLERYRTLDNVEQAVADWLKTRQQVPDVAKATVDPRKQGPNFTVIDNCSADAFHTARQTLLALIQAAGANSAEVHDWLNAQDEVFENCTGAGPVIPKPAPSGGGLRVRANRAYQIAAAEFYSAKYDDARTAFAQIASDTGSPWRVIAPYLVARCYLRQDNFKDAQQQLSSILADPSQATIHPQAQSLLDYAAARLDPPARLLAAAQALMRTNSRQLGHDLNDLTFLFDRLENPSYPEPPFEWAKYQALVKQSIAALQSAGSRNDLLDWILCFQNQHADPRPRASSQRWPARSSLPWLLEELQYSAGKQASPELINAAQAVPRSSPAYATARFQAARLLIEANRTSEAVTLLDDVLLNGSSSGALDTSTLDAFRAARMKVAQSFEEFLTYASRTPTGEFTPDIADDAAAVFAKPPVQAFSMFDQDGASALNRSIPLSLWLRAAQQPTLTAPLRIQIAQAGWVRALLLETTLGKDFARQLSELKPSYSGEMTAYLAAPDRIAARFEAAFIVLHHPEMQPDIRAGLQRQSHDEKIDDYRDNWWPPAVYNSNGVSYSPRWPGINSGFLAQLYPKNELFKANFLTPAQTEEVAREQKQFVSSGGAPSSLAAIVVSWVAAHPSDPRNAEALALAVKTSRFSLTDTAAPSPVEKAFHLLHNRYPNTAWAKKTPFWYR